MTHVNFAMTTLLNGIWEGAFLAVAMWLFLKLLPRLNPTTRFTVLWVTLLAIVALLLEPFMPRTFIPGAQTVSPSIATTLKPTTSTLASIKTEQPQFSVKNSDTRSESHPELVLKSNPEPVSEPISGRASEFVETRSDTSRSGSLADPRGSRPTATTPRYWRSGLPR